MTDAPDALRQNRRLVILFAIASGAIGLMPLPLLPEVLLGALRSVMLRRLARRRGVRLTHPGARVITGGRGTREAARRLAALSAALLGARALGRLRRTLLALFRFEEMGHTFLLGTYFDHYLLTLHQGDVITTAQAARLRAAALQAHSGALLDVLVVLFRRALADLFRLWTYIPRRMITLTVRLLRSGEQELETTEEEEQQLGILSRAVALVEQELDATGRAVVEAICLGFDEAWAVVTAEERPPGPPHERSTDPR